MKKTILMLLLAGSSCAVFAQNDTTNRNTGTSGSTGTSGTVGTSGNTGTNTGVGTNTGAPVLIDKNQAMGPPVDPLLDPKLTWYTQYGGKNVPCGTHRGSKAVPDGGNFLFEDGHVVWHDYNEISLGGQVDGFLFFYKIKI